MNHNNSKETFNMPWKKSVAPVFDNMLDDRFLVLRKYDNSAEKKALKQKNAYLELKSSNSVEKIHSDHFH